MYVAAAVVAAVAVVVARFTLTAALLRFAREFFDNAEVRLTAQRVYPQKAHQHLVAAPERTPALLAEGKSLVRVEYVEVITCNIAETHQAFGNRVCDRNVDTPFLDARDGRLEVIADVALQNPAAAHLDGDAFGFLVLDFVCRNQVADFNHAVFAFGGNLGALAREFTVTPQVGVTTNRARKVRIVLPVQRKVAEAVAVVMRLLHAAQNAVGQSLVALGALHQMFVQLECRRVQVRVAAAGLAQVAQHHRRILEQVRVHVVQFHDVLGIRCFMDTVNALELTLLELLRAAVVRDEHAFFHPRIRFVGRARVNLFRFAFLVELAAEFGALEFQQAVLGAVLLQKRRHLGERLDVVVAVLHHFHRLLVGDGLGNLHDAAVEIPTEHVRVLVEFHHAGECAAVHALVQTAHVARKLFRKHRHSGPRQVLRVAPFQSLFVEFAPFGYVVAHVGNVHAQPVAALGGAFHANGVVMVHGAIGVDTENRELPVIHAALEVLAARLLDAVYILLDGRAEVLRQVRVFHELCLDFVPADIHRFGSAVDLCQVAVLEFRVRVQRKADGFAFLARGLPAVAHLVHLSGFEFVHFPVFFARLVQNAAFHAGFVFLSRLAAAAGTQAAVVFGVLFRNLFHAFFALFFDGFAIAQLVFLVAGTLQKSAVHHVGEHLLKGHLLLFGETECAAQAATDHRFVAQNCNNLFFAR